MIWETDENAVWKRTTNTIILIKIYKINSYKTHYVPGGSNNMLTMHITLIVSGRKICSAATFWASFLAIVDWTNCIPIFLPPNVISQHCPKHISKVLQFVSIILQIIKFLLEKFKVLMHLSIVSISFESHCTHTIIIEASVVWIPS